MEKENKTLNLCEKLAGCPEGTKLWSPLLGDCEFVALSKDMKTSYPNDFIVVDCDEMGRTSFDKHGHYFSCSEECLIFPSRENRDWDNWECPKPKVERFDPKTLQPFDKVLGRINKSYPWRCDFLSQVEEMEEYPVVGVVNIWKYCVPYNEDTKHLLGTKDEAPEYYRWWEDKA